MTRTEQDKKLREVVEKGQKLAVDAMKVAGSKHVRLFDIATKLFEAMEGLRKTTEERQ